MDDSQPTCLTNLKKEHWDHRHEIGVSKFGKEKERERESVCVCVCVCREEGQEGTESARVFVWGPTLRSVL